MVKEDWGELSAINLSLKKIEEFIQIMIWLPAWLQNQPFNSSKLGVWMPGILNAVSWNHTLLHPSYLPFKKCFFVVFCVLCHAPAQCRLSGDMSTDSRQFTTFCSLFFFSVSGMHVRIRTYEGRLLWKHLYPPWRTHRLTNIKLQTRRPMKMEEFVQNRNAHSLHSRIVNKGTCLLG